MFLDRFGQLDDPFDPAANGPSIPAFEKFFGLQPVLGAVNKLQTQLEDVGLDASQVEPGQAA